MWRAAYSLRSPEARCRALSALAVEITGLPRLSRRGATSSSARLVEIEALGPKTAPVPAQLSAQARA